MLVTNRFMGVLRAAAASFGIALLGVVAGSCGPSMNAPEDAAVDAGPQTHATYWRDVAPILQARCIACHTAGGIGPMPLTTYAEARPFARLMANETTARRMPPWPPSDNCRPLQNPRGLAQPQIDLIAAWAADGAPEGNQSDYVAPVDTATGRMLPPTGDLAVQPDEPYTPTSAGGNDDYHCFIMDPHLTANRDVVGVRVTPGNAHIVHHVILYEIRPEALTDLQRLDDDSPGPGYRCFGGSGITVRVGAAPTGSNELASFNQQGIGGWAPGGVATYFPDGTGIRLAPGSRLVMQVHYSLGTSTAPVTDRTRVDLYFSPQPVASPALWSPFYNYTFRVPAGAHPPDSTANVTETAPAIIPVRLFGLTPHMHLLGQSIRVDVVHSNNRRECLIDVPRWDFHWQQSYWLASPMPIAASGIDYDQFVLNCTYDNSERNQPTVNGVRQAPRDVTWGENSSDEMCLNFFYVAR